MSDRDSHDEESDHYQSPTSNRRTRDRSNPVDYTPTHQDSILHAHNSVERHAHIDGHINHIHLDSDHTEENFYEPQVSEHYDSEPSYEYIDEGIRFGPPDDPHLDYNNYDEPSENNYYIQEPAYIDDTEP